MCLGRTNSDSTIKNTAPVPVFTQPYRSALLTFCQESCQELNTRTTMQHLSGSDNEINRLTEVVYDPNGFVDDIELLKQLYEAQTQVFAPWITKTTPS